MHSVWQDLRFGARLFAKSPGFSAAALTALVLGMGAATAIFSIVNAVLLKPLPFRDARRLVVVWEKNPSLTPLRMFAAPYNFREWRQQSRTFECAAAIQQSVRVSLTAGPNGHIEPEELHAERVTASLFEVLGVQPSLGRGFLEEEDQPGHAQSAILSHSLWQRRFGADPGIAGKPIQMSNRIYAVAGVMPAGFGVLDATVDVWLPLALNPGDSRAAAGRTLTVVARLRAGADIAQARAELESIGNGLERANPGLNKGWRPYVFPLQEELVGDVRRPLLILLGAVGLLLLMACANVANLLLARAGTRRREVAIRVAMGARRGAIVRQLLAESMLLASAGAVLGLLLARAGVALLSELAARSIPRLAEVRQDSTLCVFTVVLAVATGLLFGIVPALENSMVRLSSALGAASRGGTMSRAGRSTRSALVVAEVALAVLVLIAAGLLMRSFERLRAADPGFRAERLLTFRLPLGGGRNTAPERRIEFFEQVQQAVQAIPGVEAVGAVNSLPLAGMGAGTPFTVEGRPAPPPAQRPIALMRSVTASYFRTVGIRLLAGREFTAADTAQSTPVLMVGETLARRFWPNQELNAALGGRLVLDAANVKVGQIVGVVGDVKADRLDGEDWPTVYNPYPQAAAPSMSVVVRTAGTPQALAGTVQRAVHRIDPDQPVANLRPMTAVVDEAVAAARFDALVLAIFGVAAFLLAAVGIYGVISYDVSERAHEFGIRLALGAQRANVLRMVVGQGARLAVLGIAIGLAAAFALTRVMGSMLYGVQPTDANTFAAISLLLGVVALAASYLPSRRALALDPAVTLRHE